MLSCTKLAIYSLDLYMNLLNELIRDFKQYLTCQKKYIQVDIVSKLTVLYALLILILIFFLLGSVLLLLLSYMLTFYLASVLDSKILALLIVFVLYLALGFFIYIKRRSLILNPLAAFFANKVLIDHNDGDSHEKKENTDI